MKNYRFVGLVNINVFEEISYHKIKLVVMDYFGKADPDSAYELLKKEKSRIEEFRLKLETIIDIHSLHIDDKTISEISEICLDIRSFELRFKYNDGVDDLIESEKIERQGVFGIPELAELYGKFLILLKNLLSEKNFEIEKE